MDCLNMVRNTLNDFSRPSVKFQSDYSVVKIVDGTRRMRHLFLFDNSLVCAKPGDKLDFMIKWVLRLSQVRVVISAKYNTFVGSRRANPRVEAGGSRSTDCLVSKA